MVKHVRFLLILIPMAVLAGCHPPAASHSMTEVNGRVSMQGQPVDRVSMYFTPVEAGQGRDDVCVVEKGEYKAKLIAGKYKISFEPARGGTSIPTKYRPGGKSGPELDATSDTSKNFDLN